MYKNTISQKGFHVFGLVLILGVIGLIGFAGFKVFNLKGDSRVAGETSQKSQVPLITPPPNWKVFADKSLGVQFIYPEVYGSFHAAQSSQYQEFAALQESDQLAVNYLPGVSGFFSIGSYKQGDAEIESRAYGPRVKLDGDEWKVVRPSPYDTVTYKAGDIYSEMTRANLHGINIYTAVSKNEGSVTYRLHFMTKGILRTLQLPVFDSEMYSSTYNINDQKPYDDMYRQIAESIRQF